MRRLLPILALSLLAALAGCGQDSDPTTAGDSAGEATGTGSEEAVVDTTARTVAAIAVRHLGEDYLRAGELTFESDVPQPDVATGMVGASLSYPRAGGGELIVHVSVIPAESVGTHPEAARCGEYAECAELPDNLTLGWEKEEPEEDPGIVRVIRTGDDNVVFVSLSGPAITGDPRTLDLGGVTVEELIAVASDPDLHLRVSQTVADSAAQLPRFE